MADTNTPPDWVLIEAAKRSGWYGLGPQTLAALPDEVALLEGTTPGPWEPRIINADGEVVEAFVTAPDVNGYHYDAEILGDDEYCEQSGGMTRKVANVKLIAAAPDLARENARLRAEIANATVDAAWLKTELAAKDAEIERLRSVNAGLVEALTCIEHAESKEIAKREARAALAAAKGGAA